MRIYSAWVTRVFCSLALAGAATISGALGAGSAATVWPGQRPDGSVQLPNQWSLRPVGRQIPMADYPVNIAVHPSGRFAVVLHSGYAAHKLLVVNLQTAAVVCTTPVHESFYGLEFAPDGKTLYCSGAGDEVIHQFTFQEGTLVASVDLRLRDIKERGVPAGLAVDGRTGWLYAANLWNHTLSRVSLGDQPEAVEIRLGTNVPPAWQAPNRAPQDFDTAAAEKRAEALLAEADPRDSFPYACRVDSKHHRAYVSLWAQASVAVIDLKTETVVARWSTQEHPCEMILSRSGDRLYVANSSRNTVSVLDTRSGRAIETLRASLYPEAMPGSTPNSLALTPDEHLLFVANADNNAVAVFDVAKPGKSRSLGFIPVGWHPTSVRVTPDGKRLLVANGKGLSPKPIPRGAQPGRPLPKGQTMQYIGSLFEGTLSLIDLPARADFERQLAEYTAQAYRCSPLRPTNAVAVAAPDHSPIPAALGQPSPIKYVLYVIKENRTYDQVLGDVQEGNGDPKLCLFPERVTPNLHRLVHEFVLLDNFYVDSEVSADGHEWSMGAYATDFVDRTWRMSYGHGRSEKYPYPSEGNFAVAFPAEGYIWDRAREAGVSYRSYGEFVKAGRPDKGQLPALRGHFDPEYRGFDLSYPDVKRADRFIAELNRFEREGDMPRLQILRLPNDHTHGASKGNLSPTAFLADNDLAVGRLVEAVSRSKFWPQIAIFVVEDDAQNGPDHVDAHRTTAYVISPYVRRHTVDSTLYSTSSMLRTMELILGLRPMSQFDAAATPMYASFQPEPDLAAYQALPANVDLKERNPATAWGGELHLNYAREDAIDDLLLNEMVWRAVRGADQPMPAPVRAAFVFARPNDRDDD